MTPHDRFLGALSSALPLALVTLSLSSACVFEFDPTPELMSTTAMAEDTGDEFGDGDGDPGDGDGDGDPGGQAALTPLDTVVAVGMPGGVDGRYVFLGQLYEGSPVYRHEPTDYRLYRKLDGNWYIQAGEPTEAYHAATYTIDQGQTPWDATWKNATQGVSRVPALYVISHASLTGLYEFTNEAHDNQLVYARSSNYMFYQAASDRWWLNDGNDVNYAKSNIECNERPWECNWGGANDTTVLREIELTVATDSQALAGAYAFDGELHDGKPVFAGASAFVYYVASEDRWYLNDVVGQTNAFGFTGPGCELPWRCASFGGAHEGFMIRGRVTDQMDVALRTVFATYLEADNGTVTTSAENIGPTTEFELFELSTGEALLRTDTGNFVCPRPDGSIRADSPVVADDCHLTLLWLEDGQLAMMVGQGTYVSAENQALHSDATHIRSLEMFGVVPL